MTKRFKAQDASEPIYSVTEPNLTEPANYRGSSYTTVSKKNSRDIETAMYQSAGIIIIGTITIRNVWIAIIICLLAIVTKISYKNMGCYMN